MPFIPTAKQMTYGKPKFSVIMPLYNHEQFIGESLYSVLRQSYSDFELIICSDGSTDASLEVVSGIRDDRIFIINKPNSGTVSALNACIVQSKGDLVCWLSSDDVFHPEKLRTHAEFITLKSRLNQ